MNRDTKSSTEQLLLELLCNEFHLPIEDSSTELLDSGLIDSLTLVGLLAAVEERSSILLPFDELELEDLQNVNSLSRWIDAARTAKP